MRVLNAEGAIVAREKIVDYLLSTTHPRGKSKQRFFRAFGFTPDAWEEMAEALRGHVVMHDVVKQETVSDGERYTVIGQMDTPDGRRPMVRAVWQVDTGTDVPRFITAYPA